MLRSNYHKCNAEESVGPSCVYPKLFGNIFKREIDERAAALAYPMLLLSLDVWEIVNVLEALQELIGILGNAKIPNVL